MKQLQRLWRIGWIMVFMLLVGGIGAVSGQEGDSPTGVYVTTQDFLSLRQGPGTAFQRLLVVPAAITLPAYGRTEDTRWIQVMYEGQRGWLASRYLVWSGEIINLPVDGVDPYPFIRRAAALGVTTREAPIFAEPDITGEPAATIPLDATVELTGRLGERGFFLFQLRWNNELYWIGNWNIRITDGNYLRLLDLAYLYPYGRLVRGLQRDVALAVGSFQQIESVWSRIGSGQQVACSPVPPYVERSLTEQDTLREPLFTPAVTALASAITGVNGAISAFEDACAPEFILTVDYINAQRIVLDTAERDLIIAASFLEPLRLRNPQLDITTSQWTGGY